MASGGARNRSGPAVDPRSARSDARGLQFKALPAAGYSGPVPEFPLPSRRVYYVVDKVRFLDEEATRRVREREAEMWAWVWRQPQAHAWSLPGQSWRLQAVAMWVRTYVVCESGEATAADRGSLHRFADQIGLTPAGLKENGWAIAADELADKREDTKAAVPAVTRRMRAVAGSGGD